MLNFVQEIKAKHFAGCKAIIYNLFFTRSTEVLQHQRRAVFLFFIVMSNEKHTIEECLVLSIEEKSTKKSCCFDCAYYRSKERYCGEGAIAAWSKENYLPYPAEFHNHGCTMFVDNN